MTKIKNLTICIFLILFANIVIAGEVKEDVKQSKKAEAKLNDPAEFQKVIDEYKAYVAKIPPEIRDEVVAFRKKVAELNKEKKLLYKQLSQDSQNYLKKEQQYKKKLPLKRKGLINIEQPAEESEQSSEK
jgi:hypothetical protein